MKISMHYRLFFFLIYKFTYFVGPKGISYIHLIWLLSEISLTKLCISRQHVETVLSIWFSYSNGV